MIWAFPVSAALGYFSTQGTILSFYPNIIAQQVTVSEQGSTHIFSTRPGCPGVTPQPAVRRQQENGEKQARWARGPDVREGRQWWGEGAEGATKRRGN